MLQKIWFGAARVRAKKGTPSRPTRSTVRNHVQFPWRENAISVESQGRSPKSTVAVGYRIDTISPGVAPVMEVVPTSAWTLNLIPCVEHGLFFFTVSGPRISKVHQTMWASNMCEVISLPVIWGYYQTCNWGVQPCRIPPLAH